MRYFKGIILIILSCCLFALPIEARRAKGTPQTPVYSIIDPQEEMVSVPFIPPGSTILRDNNGRRFIILSESSRYNYLAYLLGRDIFNIPEIRIVTSKENPDSQLSVLMEQRGLSEIEISMLLQDCKSNELPAQDNSLAALIVFWTFLRDGDHHFYTNLYDLPSETGQKIYMSYDHGNMNLNPVSVSSWIDNELQVNFKRIFNVAKLSPAAVINIAHQTQKYYTDELLASIVSEAGFGEKLLQIFKSRRDSLVSDIKTLLTELGVLSEQDLILSSEKQGVVILPIENMKNIKVPIAYVKETLKNPDSIEAANYPVLYTYTKDIRDKGVRIRVKVDQRGEVFWADSKPLIIY